MTLRFRPPPTDAEGAGAAEALFTDAFGHAPDGVWAAPGRVNLIGEHVDYNAGLCLPVALPHRTFAAVRRRDDDRVGLVSAQQDPPWHGTLDDVAPGDVPGWAGYVAGVLWALRADGVTVPGVDVAVHGGVPMGSGLSSSAALECSVALALADLVGGLGGGRAGEPQDEAVRRRLVAACVRAENEFVGAPTGGMDQAVALLSTAGHGLLLDCLTGVTTQVPLELHGAGLALLVIDTRAPHRLVDGQYASRRAACEQAADLLGVTSLREVADGPRPLDRLDVLDEVLARRAKHVVTEIERVRSAVAALRDHRFGDLGALLDASHASLRDDYEVSSRELDVAVSAARSAGALGARMTGGGFGGSAVALVRSDAVDAVAAEVLDAFCQHELADPAFIRVGPAGAASRLR